MYSSIMAVIAAGIGTHSAFPLGLGIFVVVALLAALAATGYFIGREYVTGRWNRRDWN
jgi:Ni,Fe-hydrogenase I cytochrome b subunit